MDDIKKTTCFDWRNVFQTCFYYQYKYDVRENITDEHGHNQDY